MVDNNRVDNNRADQNRIAVFASGNGTNLQAIIDAKISSLHIALVFCNNSSAYAIERAKKHKLPFIVIDHKDYKTRESYEEEIIKSLEPFRIDYVVLAGFMRVLSPLFVRAYKNRIINVHPALLPSFPGMHAVRQALEYGVKYTGVTVHLVDEGVDTGPIILQSVVEVTDSDTELTLAEKIHKAEHKIYPEAIKLICEERIIIQGRRIIKKS